MTVNTATGFPVDASFLRQYFKTLVNHFFKILPMREQGEESLATYIESLQVELIGCQSLIENLNEDSCFITLLSILQYLIDHPDCSIRVVKREVFHAISICNKLKSKYIVCEVSE